MDMIISISEYPYDYHSKSITVIMSITMTMAYSCWYSLIDIK